MRSPDGGIGTIFDDKSDAPGMGRETPVERRGCGGSEKPDGGARGSWDELMDDSDLFDDEDPWAGDDSKNR